MDVNYLMNFNPSQLLFFAGTQAFASLVRGKPRVAPGIFGSSLTLHYNRVVHLISYFSCPNYFSKKSWVGWLVCLFLVEEGISRPHPRYQVWRVLLGWLLPSGLFSGFLKVKCIRLIFLIQSKNHTDF